MKLLILLLLLTGCANKPTFKEVETYCYDHHNLYEYDQLKVTGEIWEMNSYNVGWTIGFYTGMFEGCIDAHMGWDKHE